MKYKKRPVEVDVVIWDGSPDALDKIRELRSINGTLRGVALDGTDLLMETLEGIMRAFKGDYIIRGVQGEIYPCKPDIFAQTYDPA